MTAVEKSSGSSHVKPPKGLHQLLFLGLLDRNQIRLSTSIMVVLYTLHFLVPNQKYTSRFISLQYCSRVDPVDGPLYDIGFNDLYFVLNWLVNLTFLRAFLMQYVFNPIAQYHFKINSRKARVRFAEQSWSDFYYSSSFFFGIYLYYNSPYYLNLSNIYSNWPHNQLTGSFKVYYLISIAFWTSQIFVLNIEERRKDHYEMFAHHIITLALGLGSYFYFYTRIGHLILLIMDSVDIFLSTAKLLRYTGHLVACDVTFVLFLISWIIMRHGVYNYLFYYSWSIRDTLWEEGKCIPDAIQRRCLAPHTMNVFFALLGGLQIISCVWMYFISKIAYKVITGQNAEDVRSDDDDTDEEEEKVDWYEESPLTDEIEIKAES